ncbi:hypothetical protein [Streptosporangium sp. NPDC001681]|uniref:hypothetical protein n=1 Tax=Streptosporangium sp. NPDC001681 TaxID=3154395 RepID=UPI00332579DC
MRHSRPLRASASEVHAIEAILRRFTESASHLAYQAMLEVGRAQKTTFVTR